MIMRKDDDERRIYEKDRAEVLLQQSDTETVLYAVDIRWV